MLVCVFMCLCVCVREIVLVCVFICSYVCMLGYVNVNAAKVGVGLGNWRRRRWRERRGVDGGECLFQYVSVQDVGWRATKSIRIVINMRVRMEMRRRKSDKNGNMSHKNMIHACTRKCTYVPSIVSQTHSNVIRTFYT